MKHALIMSGGGALGAYEAGAAPILLNHYAGTDSPITIFSGTSVGALSAAALVQGATHADLHRVGAVMIGREARAAGEFLERIWVDMRPGDIIKDRWFNRTAMAWRLLRGRSVYDARPLERLLARTLDAKAIRRSPWQLLVHMTNVDTKGQVTACNSDEQLLAAVLASASIPVAFSHVNIGGLTLVDGGVVANTPMGAAIAAGAEMLTVIYLDDEHITPRTTLAKALEVAPAEPKKWAPIALGHRCIETMMTAHIERDLRMVGIMNQLVEAGGAPGRRYVRLQVLKPRKPLGPEGSTLNFDSDFVRGLIHRGRDDAWRMVRVTDELRHKRRKLRHPSGS